MEKTTFKKITHQNIADEHICCAFSDKKCAKGYQLKKKWLADQLDDGYTFRKLDVRGKVFIEYCKAEKGWLPIEAPGYMLINCFWVSGRFKKQGYAKELLNFCKKDAQGMNGLVAVVAEKKQPFMSDRKFFIKQGFKVCDTADPYFQLLYLPFNEDGPIPSFKAYAKKATCDINDGLSVYYTDGCPFNDYYVNVELKRIADERGIPITIRKFHSPEEAQNHFVPHSLYSVFYNGKFITQQVLNENLFDKLIPTNT